MDSEIEKRIAEQRFREMPPEWRTEILSAAQKAAPAFAPAPSRTLAEIFRDLIWPHPRAWAGLATIWVAIVIIQFASREESTVSGKQVSTAEWAAALHERNRLLAELNPPRDPAIARKEKPATPAPRSERRKEEDFIIV